MAKRLFSIPPIKQFSSRREWEAACWKKLTELAPFLNVLTTPRERHDLVLRVAAVDRIRAGRSYRQIARELWLSPQTISAIKRALREHAYKSYRQRGKTERKPFPRYRTFPDPLSQKVPRRTKYGTIYVRR